MTDDGNAGSGEPMLKSAVIATCLLNSKMFTDLAAAQHCVRALFKNCFPTENFHEWDSVMSGGAARNVIAAVGGASRINIEFFIWDLWEGPTRPPRPAGH